MSKPKKFAKNFIRERHGHETGHGRKLKKYVTPLEKNGKKEKEDENEIEMDKKEFVKEHKRLINVLESKDRKDDKVEAKKQKKELKEYAKKAYDKKYPPKMKCGEGKAGEICRRNNAKLNKSLDFKDVTQAVDRQDHYTAETTVPAQLMEYLSLAKEQDLAKLPFEGGVLIINKMQRGLYKATFEDQYGDTLENFDPQTLEMLAKNLMVKQLYSPPVTHDAQEEAEDRYIAREEVEDAMDRHNALYHQGQAPGEPVGGKGHVRIKYGNFELEIKKSIHDFARNFKKSGQVDRNTIAKSVKAWRRNHFELARSDAHAASELLENWEQHKESFFQTIYAMQHMNKKGS